MDWATFFASLAGSFGLTLPAAGWLSRSFIDQRLKRDLAAFQSQLEEKRGAALAELQTRLDGQRERDQARLEGEIRQRVDTTLAEGAAERQYAFEARKRLYSAIGPLRFQLLLACRDLAGRIIQRGSPGREDYSMSVRGYYGRSSLFRILRPLALTELIEREIAYADFSVDSGAVDLLRFRRGAFEALAGDLLVHGHPRVNWNDQAEHVFVDNIGKCANALIVKGAAEVEYRVMRFHEFDTFVGTPAHQQLMDPFPRLLEQLSPKALPLFWLRLVGYGMLANSFVNKTGLQVGFERSDFPVSQLLAISKDETICANIDEYVRRCTALSNQPL